MTSKDITANWKTTVLGLALALVGVVQASKKPTLTEAVKDPGVQVSLIAAVLGVLAKDADKTGAATPKQEPPKSKPEKPE